MRGHVDHNRPEKRSAKSPGIDALVASGFWFLSEVSAVGQTIVARVNYGGIGGNRT
jgi:hypothetical protein